VKKDFRTANVGIISSFRQKNIEKALVMTNLPPETAQ
jgi:hypothetical protein